jgi:Thioredoxin like C-terminal domain
LYPYFSKINSPELYFGYQFARVPLENPDGFNPDKTVDYSLSKTGSDTKPNIIHLDGTWKNNVDNMELQSNTGRITLVYSAKSINVVAGGNGEGSISEDGSTFLDKNRGADPSEKGRFAIDGQRPYDLSMHDNYGAHSMVIEVKEKGPKPIHSLSVRARPENSPEDDSALEIQIADYCPVKEGIRSSYIMIEAS